MKGNILSKLKNINLEKDPIVCVLLDSKRYHSQRDEVYAISKESKGVLLVTLTTGYKKCASVLQEIGAEHVDFCILDGTGIGAVAEPESGFKLVNSDIRSLTKLALSISESMRKKKLSLMILDSISSLYSYHAPDRVERFVHYLTMKMRRLRVESIFLAIKDDQNITSIMRCGQYFDKMI